jgi:hypothetical protein
MWAAKTRWRSPQALRRSQAKTIAANVKGRKSKKFSWGEKAYSADHRSALLAL